MKWRVTPILIAVAVVVLSSLACLGAQSKFVNANSPDNCDASAYLEVKAEITKDQVNQFGTRECQYKLTITSLDVVSIWPYIYRWEEDGYQNTKEGEWLSYEELGPGESREWSGMHITYTDPDASGPYVLEFQRIAGVTDSPECQALNSEAGRLADNGILKEFSIPLPDNPCAPVK